MSAPARYARSQPMNDVTTRAQPTAPISAGSTTTAIARKRASSAPSSPGPCANALRRVGNVATRPSSSWSSVRLFINNLSANDGHQHVGITNPRFGTGEDVLGKHDKIRKFSALDRSFPQLVAHETRVIDRRQRQC